MNKFHIKKFSGFFVGTILASSISFIITYIMNYNLSPTNLGQYSFYYNILNLSFPIVSLSLYASYIRFNNKADFCVFNFIFRRCVLAFFLLFVGIFIFFEEFKYSFFAFVIFFQERAYYFRSRQEILKYNILNVSSKLIFLLLVLYILLIEKAGYLSGLEYLSFWGVSYFILFMFFIPFYYNNFNLGKNTQKLSEVEAKKIVRFSIMTTLMTVVIWFSAVSDQFLIKYYYNFEAVGEYSVAFRVITLLSLVSGVFLSYYPVMYYKDMKAGVTKNILFFRKAFFITLFFGISILFVFSDYIYILFGAEKYIESISYFKILILAEGFRLSASIFMTFKSYKLQQAFIFKSLLFVSTLNIALNVIFLPLYGPVFAAVSTLITYFVYFLFSLKVYLLERKYMNFIFLEVK
mgnify:CR=1 FL=1